MNRIKELKLDSIIFVGNGSLGSNALSLFDGFRSVFSKCHMIDTRIFESPPKLSIRNIVKHFFPKFYNLFVSIFLSLHVKFLVRKHHPDVFFVFKGIYVTKECLDGIDAIKVHYHPDDSSSKENRTDIFDKAELAYNLHFTSKRHNVSEISERTGKSVYFIWYAYDERWHFRNPKMELKNRSYLLGFIGHFRPDRSEMFLDLSQHLGKQLAIAGKNWNRVKNLLSNATVLSPQYGESFSNFCGIAPVQLGLLNSANRDLHTARSFEIPATGALLIAQNTSEHREIFNHMRTALLFDTLQDVYALLDWIEKNPLEAQKIADMGHALITSKSNKWKDRAKEIFLIIKESHEISSNYPDL
jgi:hypothetical protein